jgi:hypothetical protein
VRVQGQASPTAHPTFCPTWSPPPPPQKDLSNPYVKNALQLEQWLMEGAYNKVLAAGQQLPGEFAAYYIEMLTSTVRGAGGQGMGAGESWQERWLWRGVPCAREECD